MTASPYLTAEEAAERLRITTRTLARYRRKKTGPAFSMSAGKVLYLISDLDEYVEKSRVEPLVSLLPGEAIDLKKEADR